MAKDKKIVLGGTPSNQHWERTYDTRALTGDKHMDAFVEKRSKDRPQPHVKVNETDH